MNKTIFNQIHNVLNEYFLKSSRGSQAAGQILSYDPGTSQCTMAGSFRSGRYRQERQARKRHSQTDGTDSTQYRELSARSGHA